MAPWRMLKFSNMKFDGTPGVGCWVICIYRWVDWANLMLLWKVASEIPLWKRDRIPPPCMWVVRGNGKGSQCPGVHLGHLVPGGYKYGDLALQVGDVSRIGTIKYGLESRGIALARTSSNSKLQTRPLVRESATTWQTCNCQKKI
jgi:hypothetical protein